MGAHRQQRGRRAARPAGKRAATVRPRYGRIGAATFSLVITTVALLAGVGILPVDGSTTPAAAEQEIRTAANQAAAAPPGVSGQDARAAAAATVATSSARSARAADTRTALPPASGAGKRVVFAIEAQRVWLVDGKNRVLSTHLASGSVTDNLKPGTYAVYSRSRHAVGIDDSGTMEYFVRFTRGERAAIGFHSIPVKDGKLLQTVAQLGTPTSHGCIRQEIGDAERLWDFAPVGTTVVVTA